MLGFDSVAGYEKHTAYMEALIGRYGNRIAKGRFTLAGREYVLAANNGENHLHGGPKGYDKVVWTARPSTDANGANLELTYLSRDGEEGYPGALKITDYYDRLAVNGAISTLDAAARGLTRDVLRDANGKAGDFAAWARSHAPRLAPAKSALDEIVGTGEITVSRLTVAAGQVRELVAG